MTVVIKLAFLTVPIRISTFAVLGVVDRMACVVLYVESKNLQHIMQRLPRPLIVHKDWESISDRMPIVNLIRRRNDMDLVAESQNRTIWILGVRPRKFFHGDAVHIIIDQVDDLARKATETRGSGRSVFH